MLEITAMHRAKATARAIILSNTNAKRMYAGQNAMMTAQGAKTAFPATLTPAFAKNQTYAATESAKGMKKNHALRTAISMNALIG